MPVPSSPAGREHVEECMGTVFTIAIRDPGDWDNAITDAVSWLHRIDRLFSTYRPDSDIRMIRRGVLTATTAHPLVREVLDLCTSYENETDGYFSADLPDGLDPSGLVKGWAIARASELLHERGSHNHAVNGGGDMQLAGEAAPGQPWRVGIADPHDRTRVLTTVTGRNFAIATSGTGERGHHIVNPRQGKPAQGLAGVTVIGPSIERADVYATAAIAMGSPATTWLDNLPDHHALIVFDDTTMLRSSKFNLLAAPTDAATHEGG